MMTGRGATPLGWTGLVLAWLIVPIVLSGVVLTGAAAVDRPPAPVRQALGARGVPPADHLVELVRRGLPPGARVAALTLPGPNEAAMVMVTPSGLATGAASTGYYVDPVTGHRLGVAGPGSDLFYALRLFHQNLGMENAGRAIAGLLGLALMLSCLTGVHIGWPHGGGWRQVMRMRRRRDGLILAHHLLGGVTIVPLFLLALTGTGLAFPALAARLAGGPLPSWSEPRAARPMARPAQPLAVVLGRAADLHPNAAVRTIIWPTERDPDWTLRFADPHVAPVKVADDTGNATAVPARPPAAAYRGMRDWHGGAGPAWRGVLVLTGLLDAAMAVTGLILWRRTRRRPDHEAAAVVDI
ncbi:PepSY-associated TM helix domain-containing protein [Sphingomonas abaci]|uniref:Putative iron-regulated membrane protein n=1 Tax=Sphingomonas abaci TaxID=237611 RepID=A0A7W7AL19_9SPHN|nr:PepSY-associated TM helix domain-containing protein [Sphingomonas abaci]MBB4619012.1 putative iron-regulated membrane protein [Sphingomonas abaci]